MGKHIDKITGGCLCGAVRYEIEGTPYKITYCHCESCRKATGAPVVVMVLFRGHTVRFTLREPQRYESSPGVQRGFCSTCGTPLTWEGVWDGGSIFEVHISTLDDPDAFVPDRHAFCRERISWFDVADEHPRYPGSSPHIAG